MRASLGSSMGSHYSKLGTVGGCSFEKLSRDSLISDGIPAGKSARRTGCTLPSKPESGVGRMARTLS